MKHSHLAILFLVLACFTAGLGHLFQLRFQFGDVYPEYSSLRADPLGTKAFFDSLAQLRPARRHYQSLALLPAGRSVTLFYLGAHPDELRFTTTQFQNLEEFAQDGGRIILAMAPVLQASFSALSPPRPGPGPPRLGRAKKPDSNSPGAEPTQPITGRWGVDFGWAPLRKDAEGIYQRELAFGPGPDSLPDSIPVHTALFFTNTAPPWRVLYSRTNSRPVMLERSFGAGSIVLCADAYLLSNEAMLLDRKPAWLAWLAGSSQQFVFEESHLGVQSAPGVATLLRKYRLHAFLLSLLLLAGLFVWKNALAFLPPLQPATTTAQSVPVAGRESAAGFANLLRRNIPTSDLMRTMLEQWKATPDYARQIPRDQLEKLQSWIDAENTLPPRQRDPVRLYNQFATVLSRHSPKSTNGGRLGSSLT